MNAGSTEHIDELSPEFLLSAYGSGYFPMADASTGEIRWYSPDPRAIIDLNELKISRSLHRTLRKDIYRIACDSAFGEVIRQCAARDETWISDRIIKAYENLFRLGFAHSVEAWSDGVLAGGLYGVALGGAFFGESMFHLRRDASKAALVGLVERLRANSFSLLDVQFMTPHLESLGAAEISRDEYLRRLRAALSLRCSFEA